MSDENGIDGNYERSNNKVSKTGFSVAIWIAKFFAKYYVQNYVSHEIVLNYDTSEKPYRILLCKPL